MKYESKWGLGYGFILDLVGFVFFFNLFLLLNIFRKRNGNWWALPTLFKKKKSCNMPADQILIIHAPMINLTFSINYTY